MKVHVGCCGFSTSIKRYFEIYNSIEIQQTFYQIPKEETLKRWKELSPKNFKFCIKCFQGVTHNINSPTWKRFKGNLSSNKENYGNLKPTKEVFDSWKETLKAANILKAEIILIQLPASFKDNGENLKNAEIFFKKVSKDIKIAFEPRGWSKRNIQKVCKKFKLIHCVDPLKETPLNLPDKTAYFRLHGKYENNKIIYNYSYSEKELKELKEKIENIKAKKVFVFFNNSNMLQDSQKFLKLLSQ